MKPRPDFWIRRGPSPTIPQAQQATTLNDGKAHLPSALGGLAEHSLRVGLVVWREFALDQGVDSQQLRLEPSAAALQHNRNGAHRRLLRFGESPCPTLRV